MELERELIIITRAEDGAPVLGAAPVDLSRIVSEAGGAMHRLFTAAPEAPLEALGAGAAAGALPAEVAFYRVDAPDERLEDLARRLQELPTVEAAYVKPPASPAVLTEVESPRSELGINDMAPRPEEPAATPDFTSRQGYLNAAPEGIDARFAWTRPGGSGAGVRIIDIEGAWRFTHEDLAQNQGGMVFGAASSDLDWRNHGTAVIGEFGGDRNTFGITGICPDANVRAISIFGGVGSARAIRQAADLLNPGDVILIELHRPGPRHTFASRLDQAGYVAIEWWPDDYQAIRYAVNKGVIVVEAAGNGQENLDDAIYDTNPPAPFGPFPSWWRNPYRRAPFDSGAIVVGAGAPPPGTHGRNHGPDRSRLSFSNYGALVDAQGWGREVTTTGYGDLQGGSNEDLWYTDTFSGTSSASPIVVGAIAGVQGVLRAAGRIPMSPARAREVLRATGSPQQDAPGRPAAQRIGNRPDMRRMIDYLLPTRTWTGVQFTGTVAARQTGRWFTHSWPAHWHVIWTVVPTSVTPGGPQIRWRVQVERASDRHITYWIEITNLTNVPVNIEARYAVLGW
jgi:hypothetical protein